MKKKFGSRTVTVLKRVLNVKSWLDWERIKGFTNYLYLGAKRFFIPKSAQAGEDFEGVKAKLNLTDRQLKNRQSALLRLSLLMLVIAFILFGYALYQFYHANIVTGFLSVIVMGIALVLAFRYHYWCYLIKERKLVCTLREWFSKGLMGNK